MRIRDLKRRAKEAMRGNVGILILASLASAGLTFLGTMLTTILFPGESVMEMILSQIFSIILSLVFSIVTAGFSYMLLTVARGGATSLGDLFYFFRHHPDRVIIASTVLAVLNVIVTLPTTWYGIASNPGSTMEEQMSWLASYGTMVAVSSLLTVLVGIPFAMMYFLLADHEEMSGMEAVKASVRMMKGRFGKYLLLQISFLPLLFLSIFTLYLALLWIMPYMEMTNTMFYRDILGEMNSQGPVDMVLPMNGNLQNPELPGDDYNSEA